MNSPAPIRNNSAKFIMHETNQADLKSRTVSSFAWAAAGTGGQVLFQVLALAILARLLTPAEFGVVSAATIIVQLSLILTEFGIGPAIVQRHSMNEIDIRVGFTLSCLFGSFVVFILWILAPTLAAMLETPELIWVIRAYAAIFIFKSYSAVADALLQRDLAFRLLARADTISFAAGYAGIGILSAYLGFSYWSLVLGHLSQSAIRAGLTLRYKAHDKNLSLEIRMVKDFIHFGLGQSASRLGSYVANQGDSFVVAKVLGVERLGEYGRANQLVVMPGNQLGGVFDKVLFPTFSMVQEDKTRFGEAYRKALSLIAMIGLPLSALLFVVAPDISSVMLGDRWTNVIEPMKVLSLGLLFRLLHKISDPTARATGAVYQRAWRQIIVAVTLVAGAYIGSRDGLVGVAWGVLAATVLDATLMVQLCSRIAGLSIWKVFQALSPGLRLGTITFLIVFGVQSMASQVLKSHLGILALTLATTMIVLGSMIYMMPKLSIGRGGLDVLEYIWSILHLEKRLGVRPPVA